MWLVHFSVFLSISVAVVFSGCPSDCNYHGHCVNNQCKCYEGFYGSDCYGDCGCEGHGACAHDNSCNCHQGWKWSPSQRKCVWDCHCQNGASCIGPEECGCTHTCKYGACRNTQCVCWEGYKGEDCSLYDPNIMMNHGVNVGINLGGITYYSSELKWVDIAKQSQEWITGRTNRHDWNTGETNKIQWRDDGYPVSLEPTLYVKKLVYRDFGDHEEDGNYTILYDGEGEIGISLTRPIIQYEGKGRIVATINVGKNGFAIEIRKTNPKNPIRNLRLLAPGYEYIYERFPYHPVFLENLKRYSEIRSMDFFSTNGHMPEPTTWATRRHSDYHTQAGDHGGAIEEFIHICNTLGASPWFNVPHAADDDFVRHMAQLAKDTVRPDLKIYIEYSNEVWNGMFRQGKYSQEQGLKLHMDTVSYKAGLKYYNKRSVEIMKLWKQVFGSSTSRLIPLYAWQTGFQDFYRKALDDLGSNINTFKAMAITGYFGCNKASGHSDFVKMSMADIEKLCENDLPNLQQKYEHYLNVSQAHGVKLLMYEGGPSVMESGTIQHHGQSHADITNHAIAFQKDSHIEKPVQDVLDLWYRVVTQSSKNSFPGGLFNYFSYTGTPTKYGSWGMFQYTGQDPHSVPKYRRVMNFINGRFPNLPLGPKCSFVKSGALAYGCFQETPGTFKCGQTDNNGRTWSYFPSLNQKHGEYLTLDGYNPKTSSLYIRVTDSIAANTYHVFNTRTRTFSSLTNFDYYTQVATSSLITRFPNGVYHGLNAHAHC